MSIIHHLIRSGNKAVRMIWDSLVQGISFLYSSNSGSWTWLSEATRPLADLNQDLWRGAVPSFNFYLMLFLSSVICTVGLLADSTAVIIGAMIITPLLNPILGITFSIVVGNRRLFKRALLTLSIGIVLAWITSIAICYLVGLRSLSPEILVRAQPTLLDLGVALAAGAAAAFANARTGVGSALPGVAIAVALLPPISVIGIGCSLQSGDVVIGAILLLLTNLTGIIFGGGLIFLSHGYGSLDRARHGLIVSIALLTFLGVPLGLSFRQLLIREQVHQTIEFLIRQRYTSVTEADVRRVEVQSTNDQAQTIRVFAEVIAPAGTIRNVDQEEMTAELEAALNARVALRLRVIPSYELGLSTSILESEASTVSQQP